MANPYLNDDAGNYWQLACTAQGQLSANFISPGVEFPLYLLETNAPSSVIYELKITAGGFLSLFLAPVSVKQVPTRVELSSGGPVLFFLRVFNGNIQLSVDPASQVVIVVGQLLPGDGAYPTPLQPGGIGTPVTMPTQTDGEKSGLWVAGCQHWFNHWDVHSAQIGGVQTALVCCPLCLYVQRLVSPYAAIHQDQNMIIFA